MSRKTAHEQWGVGSSNESDDPGCGNYVPVHDAAERRMCTARLLRANTMGICVPYVSAQRDSVLWYVFSNVPSETRAVSTAFALQGVGDASGDSPPVAL